MKTCCSEQKWKDKLIIIPAILLLVMVTFGAYAVVGFVPEGTYGPSLSHFIESRIWQTWDFTAPFVVAILAVVILILAKCQKSRAVIFYAACAVVAVYLISLILNVTMFDLPPEGWEHPNAQQFYNDVIQAQVGIFLRNLILPAFILAGSFGQTFKSCKKAEKTCALIDDEVTSEEAAQTATE